MLQWNEAHVAPTNIDTLDEILQSDGGARGLWARIAPYMRVMRNAFSDLAANEQTRYQAITALEADSTRTAAYRGEQRAEITNKAMQAIDGITTAAQQARDSAFSALDAAQRKAQNATSADQQTADELKLQAAWARLKPVLDRHEDVGMPLIERLLKAASDATAQGDTPMMRAIQREVPMYLEARGHNDPGFRARLDAVCAPLVSPVERAALVIRRDIERGMMRLAQTVTMYQKIANGTYSLRLNQMPGWGDQEQINIVP